MKIFTIYDSKVDTYLQPFFMRTVGEVERSLGSLVSDPEHNFCKYAEDFTLFELGTFNEDTAEINLLNTPHSISLLVQYKNKPTPASDNLRAVASLDAPYSGGLPGQP